MRGRRLVLVALAVATGSVLAGASTAVADGGQTIAGAPTVVFGQQEFGNTANGGEGQPGCFSSTGNTFRSWWGVAATAGDELTIDWETQSPSMYMNLFQVGTTDYNEPDQTPLVQENVNSNYKAEGTYTAIQSGVLPLEFFSDSGCGNPPAPYDFTVSVIHALAVSLSTLTGSLSGVATAGVHNPDGGPLSGPPLVVNLQVSGVGLPWTSIGSASPVNGVATIDYAVPASLAGKAVEFRAVGQGTGYQTNTSSVQTVTIRSLPPACVVPSYRVGESVIVAKRAIAAHHCSLGPIWHHRNRHVKRGGVVALSPTPGSKYPNGHPVGIIVSRGTSRR